MKNFIKSNDSQASRNEANSLTVNSSIGDSSFTDETEKDVMVIVIILVNFEFRP